jgi:hypothetical protein
MSQLRERLQEAAEAAVRESRHPTAAALVRRGRRRRLRLAGGTAALLVLVLVAVAAGTDRLTGRQTLLAPPATTGPGEVELPMGSPPGDAGEQMVRNVAKGLTPCRGGDPDGPKVLVAWGTAHGKTWLIVAKPPRPGENGLCWAEGLFNAGRISGGMVLGGGPGSPVPLKPLQASGTANMRSSGQYWGQIVGAVTKRAARVRVSFRKGIAPLDLVPIQAGDRFPVNFYTGFYRQPSKAKREWPVTGVVAYDQAGAKIAECRATFPYPSC